MKQRSQHTRRGKVSPVRSPLPHVATTASLHHYEFVISATSHFTIKKKRMYRKRTACRVVTSCFATSPLLLSVPLWEMHSVVERDLALGEAVHTLLLVIIKSQEVAAHPHTHFEPLDSQGLVGTPDLACHERIHIHNSFHYLQYSSTEGGWEWVGGRTARSCAA